MKNKVKSLALISILLLSLTACKDNDKEPENKDNTQQTKDNVPPPQKDNGPRQNIIFKDDQGNQLTSKDLENVTGTYNWEATDDKKIPDEAKQLHQEARKLGESGKFSEAIDKLTKANELAPDWAYPAYDLGYTYLLQKDLKNSIKYYELTDKIEPKGFYTAKTALWSLRKEQDGDFPPGLYQTYMQIEWMGTDAEKIEMAKKITGKFPAYAPAWKELAYKLKDNEERKQATEKGLSSDPDLETKGSLLINKAIISDLEGKKEDAKKILGEVIFAKDSTLANVELAKYVMASITHKSKLMKVRKKR
jgi:tetratricopeptide (TPR) repeat protein